MLLTRLILTFQKMLSLTVLLSSLGGMVIAVSESCLCSVEALRNLHILADDAFIISLRVCARELLACVIAPIEIYFCVRSLVSMLWNGLCYVFAALVSSGS